MRFLVIIKPDLDNVDITLDQNTGRRFWDASYLLAKYIYSLTSPQKVSRKSKPIHPFAGKSVLELGSGTSGLLPLVALSCGADMVVATDIDAEALVRLDRAVRENLAQWEVKRRWRRGEEVNCMWAVEELTWGVASDQERVLAKLDSMSKNPSDNGDTPVRFDFVIASEIMYLAGQHKNLVKTIKSFCHKDTIMYMVYKRRGLGEEGFFKMAKWAGLDCVVVPRNAMDAEFVDDLDHEILEIRPSLQ
ncbi:nicotinamide n-methyltransferase [Podochytrium sp. JEL0797]|nr:nicotinamide n-methyltransferase [Podochytrium sp. JEL0797]